MLTTLAIIDSLRIAPPFKFELEFETTKGDNRCTISYQQNVKVRSPFREIKNRIATTAESRYTCDIKAEHTGIPNSRRYCNPETRVTRQAVACVREKTVRRTVVGLSLSLTCLHSDRGTNKGQKNV